MLDTVDRSSFVDYGRKALPYALQAAGASRLGLIVRPPGRAGGSALPPTALSGSAAQPLRYGAAMRLQPSASYSFTMRLHLPQQGTVFADVAHAIAEADGMLGAIDLVRVEGDRVVRDVTVSCGDSEHAEAVVKAVRALEGVHVDSVSDRTFLMHKGGKIEVRSKLPLKTRDDLSMAYTPGVARVSSAIHDDPTARGR